VDALEGFAPLVVEGIRVCDEVVKVHLQRSRPPELKGLPPSLTIEL
jgi:hypothetical protein